MIAQDGVRHPRPARRRSRAEEILRVALRAYLEFLAGEPAFARVFYVHMPTAGSHAADRLDAAQAQFAELNGNGTTVRASTTGNGRPCRSTRTSPWPEERPNWSDPWSASPGPTHCPS